MILFLFACALIVSVAALGSDDKHQSQCFDSSFEQPRYGDLSSVSPLQFGVIALVDARYSNTLLQSTIQQTIDEVNAEFRAFGVQLVNLQVFPWQAPEIIYDEKNPYFDDGGEGYLAWRQVITQYKSSGNVVIVFHHVKDGFLAGMLVGKFPQDTTKDDFQFLFMNVDYKADGAEPLYSAVILQHEIGHYFGLFHTFHNSFGCDIGDAIDDTTGTTSDPGECNQSGVDSCDQQQAELNYYNVMSYGECQVGEKMTPNQRTRSRCTIENDISILTALPAGGGTTNPPLGPPEPPTSLNNNNADFGDLFSNIGNWGNQFSDLFNSLGNLFGRRRSVLDDKSSMRPSVVPCNGVAGVCVEASAGADCATQPTLANRCPNAMVCCRASSMMLGVMSAAPLPGVGRDCIGVRGTCLDVDVSTCSTGKFIKGPCVGNENLVQCCPAAGVAAAGAPKLKVAHGADVDLEHVIAFPKGYTVHVGATVWLPLPARLVAINVFVVRSSIVVRPTSLQLAGHDVNAVYVDVDDGSGAVVHVAKYANQKFIDRGDYVIAVNAKTADGQTTMYVSTVITVDVDSCPLSAADAARANVGYGLMRTTDACAARNGTVFSTSVTLKNDTVCCVAALVQSTFAPVARFNKLTEHVPLDVVVEWRGQTSFWGAPMTVAMKKRGVSYANAKFEARLMPAVGKSIKTLPPVALTFDVGVAQQTFTPRVANPAVFALADASTKYRSTSFSVVSMPCMLSRGVPGYCQPVRAIKVDNETTDAASVCASGERSQCAGLSVDGVSFACCFGAASELQKQASYLRTIETNQAQMMKSGVVAGMSAGLVAGIVIIVVVVLLAIGAAIWFITRRRSANMTSANNPGFQSSRY